MKNHINLQISSRGLFSPEYLEILFCDVFSFFLPRSSKKQHLVAELAAHPEDEQCLKVCDTLAE